MIWYGEFFPFCLLSFDIQIVHCHDRMLHWISSSGRRLIQDESPTHNYFPAEAIRLQRYRVHACWIGSSSVYIPDPAQIIPPGICTPEGHFRLQERLMFAFDLGYRPKSCLQYIKRYDMSEGCLLVNYTLFAIDFLVKMHTPSRLPRRTRCAEPRP